MFNLTVHISLLQPIKRTKQNKDERDEEVRQWRTWLTSGYNIILIKSNII